MPPELADALQHKHLCLHLSPRSSTAGVSAHAHKNWGTDYEAHAIFVRSVSLVLMVLSIFMAVYAAYNFHYRGEMLQ